MKSKYDIICFSSAYWDEPLWTNKQHVMCRLSQRGHRILYVEPGLSRKHLVNIFMGRLSLKEMFYWFRKENRNLWILTPLVALLRGGFLKELGWKIVILVVSLFLKRRNLDKPVLWIYHPEAERTVGHFDESFVYYDCVDLFSAFPRYFSISRKFEIEFREKKLLKKADLVTTIGSVIYEEKRKYNPHTYEIHNVGDAEHFRKAMLEETEIPEDIAKIPHPLVGFFGALDRYKVDFELIEYIANKHNDWSIVLIGPSSVGEKRTDLSSLEAIKNVYLLGHRPYEKLPNYLKAFDVCIIPYAINEYTKYLFTIKFFEFLNGGKPVVTTNLEALSEYKDIAKIAKDKEEFVSYIEGYLKRDSEEAKSKRLKIARENTWDNRIDKQLELIAARLADK